MSATQFTLTVHIYIFIYLYQGKSVPGIMVVWSFCCIGDAWLRISIKSLYNIDSIIVYFKTIHNLTIDFNKKSHKYPTNY